MKAKILRNDDRSKFEYNLEQIDKLPWVSHIHFRPGFSLFIQRMSLEKELCLSVKRETSSLHFGFLLQGSMQTTIKHCQRPFECLDCLAGTGGLLYLPHTRTKACYSARPVRGVALDLKPSLLKEMLKEDCRLMPSFLRKILSGSNEGPVLKNIHLSRELANVIAQMTAPLEDTPASRLYLEGKSLELLALLFDRLKEGKDAGPLPFVLDKKEREKINQARDLLFADLANPPALMELAAKVRMSHTRLNLGFKVVFGDTAFACLRKKRLERAGELLNQGGLSIAQVAVLSGFSDQSHLTRAFSAHFGLTPKKYIHSK
jgi:AraC-like DNA-binding protein